MSCFGAGPHGKRHYHIAREQEAQARAQGPQDRHCQSSHRRGRLARGPGRPCHRLRRARALQEGQRTVFDHRMQREGRRIGHPSSELGAIIRPVAGPPTASPAADDVDKRADPGGVSDSGSSIYFERPLISPEYLLSSDPVLP